MLVRFKQAWFGPGEHLRSHSPQVIVVPGHLYERTSASEPPVFVPDEYRSLLPASAIVVDEHGQPVPAEPVATPSLRDFDDARAASDAEEALRAKAEQFRAQAQKKR